MKIRTRFEDGDFSHELIISCNSSICERDIQNIIKEIKRNDLIPQKELTININNTDYHCEIIHDECYLWLQHEYEEQIKKCYV